MTSVFTANATIASARSFASSAAHPSRVLAPIAASELSATAKFCARLWAAGRPTNRPRISPVLRRVTRPNTWPIRFSTARAALEGERKQVTVLFVDIVGSTSRSERLDPEEVHALMGRAIELMVEEVHRYEGTVNQFLGDGVMALFGAPIAHEDHARRAVQAALAIQRALQPLDEELRSRGRNGLQVRQD